MWSMPTTPCLLYKDRGIIVFNTGLCCVFVACHSFNSNSDMCLSWWLPPNCLRILPLASMSSFSWYYVSPPTLYQVACFITVHLFSSFQSVSMTSSLLVLSHQDLPFSSLNTGKEMITVASSYVKKMQILLPMSRINNTQPLHNPYLICQCIGGGSSIKIEDSQTSVESPWHPQRTLAVKRSNHPLDIACGAEVLNQIYQSCIQEETSVIARLP